MKNKNKSRANYLRCMIYYTVYFESNGAWIIWGAITNRIIRVEEGQRFFTRFWNLLQTIGSQKRHPGRNYLATNHMMKSVVKPNLKVNVAATSQLGPIISVHCAVALCSVHPVERVNRFVHFAVILIESCGVEELRVVMIF